MHAAFLTALLWSMSSVASARAARFIGAVTANRLRLTLATALLALCALLAGPLDALPGVGWFLLSGAIGLALGDLSLFLSFERLGSRLPSLLTHCLAAPLGAMIEWLWLGHGLTRAEALGGGAILIGVAVALAPGGPTGIPRARFWSGVGFGVMSACGLALSAVVSRKGFEGHEHVTMSTMIDVSMVRGLGGTATVWLLWPLAALVSRSTAIPAERSWRRGWPWLVFSAVVGPGGGALAYVVALSQAGAGPVQAVVALVPIIVIPLAWWIEGDRPSWRSVLGGMVAVAGAVGMAIGR